MKSKQSLKVQFSAFVVSKVVRLSNIGYADTCVRFPVMGSLQGLKERPIALVP